MKLKSNLFFVCAISLSGCLFNDTPVVNNNIVNNGASNNGGSNNGTINNGVPSNNIFNNGEIASCDGRVLDYDITRDNDGTYRVVEACDDQIILKKIEEGAPDFIIAALDRGSETISISNNNDGLARFWLTPNLVEFVHT